jgi:oligopeptide/dipeptide ABC transporter ATP-binding protein
VPRLTEHNRRSRIVLEGSPPDPSNPPAGCIFHTRCRYAQEICGEEEPALREVVAERFAACHFSETLDLKGINS